MQGRGPNAARERENDLVAEVIEDRGFSGVERSQGNTDADPSEQGIL
jgi:hypothetical protein